MLTVLLASGGSRMTIIAGGAEGVLPTAQPVLADPATMADSTRTEQTQTETDAPAEEQAETTQEQTTRDYSKVKGNKITDGTDYKTTPKKEAEEDPQYRAPAKTPTTELLTDSLPLPTTTKRSTTTKPVTTTQPTTTKPVTTRPPSTTADSTQEVLTDEDGSVITDGSTTTQKAVTTTEPATTASAPPDLGWYQNGAKQYYYYNGSPVIGYQTIGGVKYFFDSKGVLTSKVGIDISKWNGTVDWKKVKASGVDFAMIRVGYRGYGAEGRIVLDERFKENVLAAADAGVDCGVYFYTQAITKAEAIEEAKFVLAAVEGFRLTYPVAFDIEDVEDSTARTKKLTTKQRTDFSIAFCETVQKSGYYPMIYANKYWLTSFLDTSRLSNFDTWLAHYTNKTDYTGAFRMWQYTESGTVKGCTGNVDRNISLFDYANYIKKNGWNKL